MTRRPLADLIARLERERDTATQTANRCVAAHERAIQQRDAARAEHSWSAAELARMAPVVAAALHLHAVLDDPKRRRDRAVVSEALGAFNEAVEDYTRQEQAL